MKPILQKIKPYLYTALILVAFSATYVVWDLIRYADTPATSESQEKIVTVHQGQNFTTTSAMLQAAGLIRHPLKFKLIARIKGYDKQIKAGEYSLSSSMSPTRILEIMIRGKVHLYKLTIPEGYNLRQIAASIARAGLGTERDFLRAATSPRLVQQKGIQAETFEGYLFPDTYYFPKDVTPETIVSQMVSRFRSVFTPAWKKQAERLGFSVHQVISLASIIEKETGVPEERPTISSVFHNRLQRRMRLESDPTVIYAIPNFDGNITRKHLITPTPYNTYKIQGLPPGPIANPGLGAIEAALYPAETRFLYFVSKKNGTHKFSTNLSDHNRAVRKYQLSR